MGIVVPTGYSFNLDGTAIYLTMASLFIADAMGDPLAIREQLSLLAFMIVASKGAAGVSGAGLAVLAGGLQSHRPELLDGIGLIVGIDRFMSEARAVTNFSGNAVATVLVGAWTKTVDHDADATACSTARSRSTSGRWSTKKSRRKPVDPAAGNPPPPATVSTQLTSGPSQVCTGSLLCIRSQYSRSISASALRPGQPALLQRLHRRHLPAPRRCARSSRGPR